MKLFSIAAIAALAVTAASASAQTGRSDISGIWKVQRYTPAITTIDGKAPPLRPEAKALYQTRIADRKAGHANDPVDKCLRPGTPRIMWQNRPFLIAVTPRKVTFVHEYQHVLRHIYLDEPLKPVADLDPWFGGSSVGRWDGDTLVVETAGFNDQIRVDEAGLPESADARVVERIRKVDANTLEDRVTITDPKNYTAPWVARVTFKRVPDGLLAQHICAEKLFPEPPNARPKG
ncbi:MAG: hypothetical protein ABIO39_08120 [Caulobacteraceae bacterium]